MNVPAENSVKPAESADISGASQAPSRHRLIIEVAQVIAQVVIAGGAMVLVYLVLALAFEKLKPTTGDIKASDVVAIVGAVTTFLGTAVGLFFGVRAGQSGKKSAEDAAQSAHQTAQQATQVAQHAQTVSAQSMDMLGQVRSEAVQSLADVRSLKNQLQMSRRASVRSASRMERLRPFVDPAHLASAEAIFKDAHLDARPTDARIFEIVTDIVRSVVANAVGLKSGLDVDTSKKFRAAPPDGLGISAGGFQQICDTCTSRINAECESSFEMDNDFRDSHENGDVDSFISDAADLAIANPRGGL